jgi:hypothetical protein
MPDAGFVLIFQLPASFSKEPQMIDTGIPNSPFSILKSPLFFRVNLTEVRSPKNNGDLRMENWECRCAQLQPAQKSITFLHRLPK